MARTLATRSGSHGGCSHGRGGEGRNPGIRGQLREPGRRAPDLAGRHQPIVRRARQGRSHLGGEQECLRPPRAGSSLSHPGQHPDGRTRVFHQRLMLARARETSLSTELHSLRDSHERIEGDLDIARAAQKAAEKIAEQAQKGEAVGQLLAGVAHDLNNVLQAATSAINLVVQRAQIDAHDAKLLSVADAALQHGAVMARRLVGFSRHYPYSPEAVDLAELAEQLSPLLQQVVGAELRLRLHTGNGGCCAMVDRHTVERAILNLVINARDACASGDSISVETGETFVTEEDAQLAKPAGHYMTLAVADSGHGMDSAVQARLFEAYFTTKHASKGAGLGLAQVYSAVRQAGGFVEVFSAPGQGARFVLAFPRVQRS
ncbi:histidine kinase [Xanthomonas citri pv. glycines]|uniref:histidine kinase n=1 Tax=Xanthomonas campestris pv. glycines TaxID=473421 RepID=A0AAX0HTR3_XANCG|nr:histidine kinase [Xanthomonas citri pv. glycines str. 12-2]OEY88016.1 histidine kinase [Xanthomonas citri pv. glycines]OOX06955.1 histidine kinase [Xanthomonas citri pv. glycines]